MELPRSSGITVNSSAPDSRRHILLHQVSLRANSGRLAKIGCLLILAGCLCLLDELRLLALGPRYVHAEVWLNLLAGTLGLYGIYLVALSIWNRLRDLESGSVVDPAARKLIWWNGQKPAERHMLPIDSIGFIVLEHGETGDRAILVDPQKRPLNVPPEVLPIPADKWAEQVATRFRHITIDRKFF